MNAMPCIPLRGLLIFPNTVLHFDVGREKSIKALETAMATDKLLFVASQKDENILIPTEDDYYRVGTVVKIKQMLKIQGDTVRVLVEGLHRAAIKEVVSEDPFIAVDLEMLETIPADAEEVETQAMLRVVLNTFDEYAKLNPAIKTDMYDLSVIMDDADMIADTIAIQLDVEIEKKQEILEALDVKERLTILNRIIFEENQILRLEKQLSEQVQENVKQNQKEYYLREQMKVIQNELGYGEDAITEAKEWEDKLKALKLDPKIEEKVLKEINKFTKMMPSSAESGVIRNYVETIVSLPWNKSAKTNSDIRKAEKILDEDHYGLDKVKERILEYLAVVQLSKGLKGPIICLVGPPGVGKTSIARSIARATGRDFVRMSLGGVRDEAEIRGHRRTYIGAIPGRIISAIKDAGSDNPLFLFDEVATLWRKYSKKSAFRLW
jgi:ATP-dependent Lon protease